MVELITVRIFVLLTNLFSVQGTASVVLAGLVAALKLLGGALGDHKFLFLGAGEVRFHSQPFLSPSNRVFCFPFDLANREKNQRK